MTDPTRPASIRSRPACNPDVMDCVDPLTGGPAPASSTGQPLTCESGTRPGAAETQYGRCQTVRDEFERAQDATCDPDRIRRLLGRASAGVCMPPAATPVGRPGVTVAQFESAQRRERMVFYATSIPQLLAADLAAEGGTQALERIAHGLERIPGVRTLVGRGAPLLALALTVRHLKHWQHSFRGLLDAQSQALATVQRSWAQYERRQNQASRRIVDAQIASVARGMDLARRGLLDDPIVQRQIEQNPYLAVGAAIEVASHRLHVEPHEATRIPSRGGVSR